MNIRVTSSLTPEDENVIAPVILDVMTALLRLLPIAYAIRIDTSDANVYERAQGVPEDSLPAVGGGGRLGDRW